MECWRSADEEISTQKRRFSRLGVDPGRLVVYFLLAGFGMRSQWHLNTACSFRSVLFRNTFLLMFGTQVPT